MHICNGILSYFNIDRNYSAYENVELISFK